MAYLSDSRKTREDAVYGTRGRDGARETGFYQVLCFVFFLIFNLFIYLYFWLHQILVVLSGIFVAACGIFIAALGLLSRYGVCVFSL